MNPHLPLHSIVYQRIIQSILNAVTSCCLAHVHLPTEIHHKQIPVDLLAFKDSMEGLELHSLQFDDTYIVNHKSFYLKNLSTSFTASGRANTATLS